MNEGNRVRLLNCWFDPLTLQQATDRIFALVSAGRGGWVCTVNVAILMMMRGNSRLQEFVDRAVLTVADGQPLVWLSAALRKSLSTRVAGIDLVEQLAIRAAEQGVKIYLLGGTAEAVRLTAERLCRVAPGLKLAYADGYFSPEEAVERARAIRESGAKILLVGMGVPRQEQFIEAQQTELGPIVSMGVGGSFDVLAGLRRRAPGWVQRGGLEWLFRLVQEPRRLFYRYLVTNTQFITLALSEWFHRVIFSGKVSPRSFSNTKS